MIKFNPEIKKELKFEEILTPAMNITNKKEAEMYLNKYEEYLKKLLEEKSQEEKDKLEGRTARELCKENLAYWAGYHGDEVRTRVEELFDCKHPIFGAIKDTGPISPEDAFKKGAEWFQSRQDR